MGQSFDVQKVGEFEKVGTENPAIYLDKVWYSLSLKDTLKTSPQFDNPACYVHRFLFEKVLGINNDAIEDNVISISHQTPVKELEQWVNKGTYQSAIYIPSMNETQFIRHVKSGCLFPQNTTFFSPKINHDLFLFLLHKQQMVLDLQNREHVA
jgi:uncharacterized protein (DUF1015 family)